jgi:hypothetical protein
MGSQQKPLPPFNPIVEEKVRKEVEKERDSKEVGCWEDKQKGHEGTFFGRRMSKTGQIMAEDDNGSNWFTT